MSKIYLKDFKSPKSSVSYQNIRTFCPFLKVFFMHIKGSRTDHHYLCYVCASKFGFDVEILPNAFAFSTFLSLLSLRPIACYHFLQSSFLYTCYACYSMFSCSIEFVGAKWRNGLLCWAGKARMRSVLTTAFLILLHGSFSLIHTPDTSLWGAQFLSKHRNVPVAIWLFATKRLASLSLTPSNRDNKL